MRLRGSFVSWTLATWDPHSPMWGIVPYKARIGTNKFGNVVFFSHVRQCYFHVSGVDLTNASALGWVVAALDDCFHSKSGSAWTPSISNCSSFSVTWNTTGSMSSWHQYDPVKILHHPFETRARHKSRHTKYLRFDRLPSSETLFSTVAETNLRQEAFATSASDGFNCPAYNIKHEGLKASQVDYYTLAPLIYKKNIHRNTENNINSTIIHIRSTKTTSTKSAHELR